MITKVSEIYQPKEGDIKTVAKYAWLPKIINGAKIWLEQYEELFVYKITEIPANIEGKTVKYSVGEWIKVTSRIIKWQIAG